MYLFGHSLNTLTVIQQSLILTYMYMVHFPTCTALSKRLQKEWKMEQHSSSLKVVGSSQKYSATASLREFSWWREDSTSATLALALWEFTTRAGVKNKSVFFFFFVTICS